jgi:hypothetical protein
LSAIKIAGIFTIGKAEFNGDLNSFDRTMSACDISSRSVGVAVGLLVLFGSALPAWAVDVVNRDRKPQEITVNSADGESKTIILRPGERVNDVCTDCVILTNTSSVETKGKTTVKIEDGELSITSR